jgi:gliding motility-associated lipoprotein GldB
MISTLRRVQFSSEKLFIIVFLIGLFVACEDSPKVKAEVINTPIELKLKRFDLAFGNATEAELPALKLEYPFLFPSTYPDSAWVALLKDTLQLELVNAIKESFTDFTAVEEEVELLFKHIKFYFPQMQTPEVVTVVSEVDYKNKIIYTDSLVLIGIDSYLGSEHQLYQGISKYQRAQMSKEQITPDIVSEFAKNIIPGPENRSFLSQMIQYGKELYLKDLLLPFKTDAEKIGYTQAQLDWVNVNEDEMWRYFVEGQLLFSNDADLTGRFIINAPFSKFYKEIDNESPGKVGQWLGWQIVRAYMENNNVTFQEMLSTTADELFKKSKYKPKK